MGESKERNKLKCRGQSQRGNRTSEALLYMYKTEVERQVPPAKPYL
jgi:hypothetical protein